MRIGANLLLLDGYCYQSYHWQMLRPLGSLQTAVDSLEEYQCDEIAIIRPIRDNDTTEAFLKDINLLKSLKSLTPISFGGGLRDTKQIDLLHQLPIERIIFSSAFIDKNISLIQYAKDLFGNQAIQCLLPFKSNDKNEITIFHSSKNSFIDKEEIDFNFINQYANEIILYDTSSEGKENKFTHNILEQINIFSNKVIISGGVGKNDIKKAKMKSLASVLIENKVLHQEYSMKGYNNV
jgi:imidazole glycerol phosphate synthase subunit HisF